MGSDRSLLAHAAFSWIWRSCSAWRERERLLDMIVCQPFGEVCPSNNDDWSAERLVVELTR